MTGPRNPRRCEVHRPGIFCGGMLLGTCAVKKDMLESCYNEWRWSFVKKNARLVLTAVLMILLMAGSGILEGTACCEEALTEEEILAAFGDANAAYIDKTGKVAFFVDYDSAWHFSEGRACVKRDGKYGYIDTTGAEVIPCQYTDLSLFWDCDYFSDGLALARKDGKYGYIDTTGKEVIPCQYVSAGDFSEGLAAVRKDQYSYNHDIIDTTGAEVTSCRYKAIVGFSEGFAPVKSKDDKMGYIDRTGKEIVPCQYDIAMQFSEGLAFVGNNGRNGFSGGYIDTTGKMVLPFPYGTGFARIDNHFSDGLALAEKDGKWGYIDKTGKEVIACQYDNAQYFTERFAAVKRDGKWGYIDTTGKEVIPCQYDNINWEWGYSGFSEGLACMEKDGKWGYIDTTGKVVIPFVFGEAESFSEGLAYVRIEEAE